MLSFLTGAGLKLLLGRVATNAKHDWQAIPSKVRLWILVAVAVVALAIAHQWYAHRQLKAADKAGYDRRTAEDAKALAALQQRVRTAEANASRIAQQLRNTHEDEIRSNAAAAAALRVRGPGAASCRPIGNPGLPGAAGGPKQAGGAADAAVPQVPDLGGSDFIALPFDAAVGFAQQHDDYRSEVEAWHKWYALMVEQWAALRSHAK